MRRLHPRPLAAAIEPLRHELAPATTLARVQEAWPEVAGPGMASEAEPASERAGTVTFVCRSSVWAAEMTMLGGELAERLNRALGGSPEGGPVRALRFVTGASRSGR